MGGISKCYMQIDSPLTFSRSAFGPLARLFLIDSRTATANQSQIKFIDYLSVLCVLTDSNKTDARLWHSHSDTMILRAKREMFYVYMGIDSKIQQIQQSQRNNSSKNVLTLVLYQTCMTFFLLRNRRQLMFFLSKQWKSMESVELLSMYKAVQNIFLYIPQNSTGLEWHEGE